MSERTMEPPHVDGVIEALGTDEATVAGGATTITWATLDGEPVVVKSATGRSRAMLRRESEALDRIEVRGLVRKVGVRDTEWATALVLRHAGHSTLAQAADLPAELVVRALLHACDVVASLHRGGWSHGAIQPDHVIVGPRGRVRLCSLGSARPISDGPGGVGRDLDGLLAVIRHAGSELEQRSGRHQRNDRRVGRMMGRICSGPAPSSAVELGSALRAVHERGPAPGRRAAVAISAAAVLLVGSGIALLWPLWPNEPTADAAGPAAAAPRPIAPPPSSDDPSTPGAGVDGGADAPATTTVLAEPGTPVVRIDGVTYSVGSPGDIAVVGDWDCDGAREARLLRPGTGELFEFAGLPDAGDDVDGRVVAELEGAADLRVAQGSGGAAPTGCEHTIAVLEDGTEVPVP